MSGFFKKLFGGKKSNNDIETLIQENVQNLVDKAGFNVQFETRSEKDDEGSTQVFVDFSGPDEDLFKDRKGQLLDAFQLYLKRVLQNKHPEDKTQVHVDCGGYREENEQALIERAENLKAIAIDQGRTVYYRALPPKERKIVHQYLAKDPRVKSRSLGDGLYKKIKIYPAKNPNAPGDEASAQES